MSLYHFHVKGSQLTHSQTQSHTQISPLGALHPHHNPLSNSYTPPPSPAPAPPARCSPRSHSPGTQSGQTRGIYPGGCGGGSVVSSGRPGTRGMHMRSDLVRLTKEDGVLRGGWRTVPKTMELMPPAPSSEMSL